MDIGESGRDCEYLPIVKLFTGKVLVQGDIL